MPDEIESVSGIDKLAALIELLVKSQCKTDNWTELSSASLNAIESRIQEFVYSPEDGSTFERWWNRHEDIFMIDLNEWSEVKKIRLLIRHVTTTVERTFTESIAPTKWVDMTLDQVKDKMLSLFGDNTSIFDRRRAMLDLRMSKENIEDVRVLAARVNQTVENAQVNDATINEWKVLTFLHSLDLPRYSDVHLKMMQTAKQQGKDCTLDDLLSVYNDISQLKKDSRMITESSREVHYVDRQSRKNKQNQSSSQQRDSSSGSEGTVQDGHTACYRCGNEEHQSFNCPFLKARCNNCGTKGHIARMCKKTKKVNTVSVSGSNPSNYRIQVTINGLDTSMAIDTGADISIISEETWVQLGRPTCIRDFGTIKCANGDDLKLRGRFSARMEYSGIHATSHVYVTHGRFNLLGKNFIKLLELVKVRAPEAKINPVKVECEVDLLQGHNGPATTQINIVKVEGVAENVRDHHVPEATVKAQGPVTTITESGSETLLHQNKSDSVKRINSETTLNGKSCHMEKANLKPSKDSHTEIAEYISVGNHVHYRTLDDLERSQWVELKIPITDDSVDSTDVIAYSTLDRSTLSPSHAGAVKQTTMTSTQPSDHHPVIVEGKPHKKMNEGNPHEMKETKQ